jgi:hypothetical protein
MRRVDNRITVKSIGFLTVYQEPISVGKQASPCNGLDAGHSLDIA